MASKACIQPIMPGTEMVEQKQVLADINFTSKLVMAEDMFQYANIP